MATPKVFVSSTCYDLKEIRDNLYEFIESLGYIPVFSDKNDVFYHPDMHTHDSCIKEIENCQLFVLIIGGRFGGEYKFDTTKSIVNAEYSAAKELKIPITTFIKDDVYSNHNLYEKNKITDSNNTIIYPAISDQKYAKNIFEFINDIRKANKNNGLFEFEFARDIKTTLKKQFAGMFFDFLWNRKNIIESEQTNKLLMNLTTIGAKTEEIIENIYRTVEPQKSNDVIRKIDNEIKAKKFWIAISQCLGFNIRRRNMDELKEFVHIEKNEKWEEYVLRQISGAEIIDLETDDLQKLTVLRVNGLSDILALRWTNNGKLYEPNQVPISAIENGFNSFKELSEVDRIKIVEEITI